jgi:ATP-binding cassette subfamily B protein
MLDENITRGPLRRIGAQLPYLSKALALVWTAAQRWTAVWVVLLILQGLLPAAMVLLVRQVVDALVAALRGASDLGAVVPPAAALATVFLLTEVLSSVATWVRAAQSELVQDHVYGLIHNQAARLDLGFYETPAYYDKLHRARVDAISQPVALLENLGRFVTNGITLVGLATVMASYAWWLPPALVAAALPALWVAGHSVLRIHRWRLHNTLRERRIRYYDWMLTWQQSAAELRLFGLGRHFRAAFQDLRTRLRSERLVLARRHMLAEVGAAAAGLVVMGLTMLWLLRSGLRGLMSLGDFALVYQVFVQGQRVMRTLLDSVGETYRNLLFLENLFEFLELEPAVVDPPGAAPPPAFARAIRIEDVTFRYPGSRHDALKDFNLTLPAGEITALVGANGGGKSTVVKLLGRFYDPQQGRVTIDGIDLRAFALDDLRRRITVLFQEPVHYHHTAADNIAFGDLESAPGAAEIVAAARAAGAEAPIARLPEGYGTVLGKWFGGAELSVGEWQRIALARAFLRRASLVVLDEPTSAMDSWAEADWMSRFRGLVAGSTALVITHRFTTALRADVIHVMEDGRIIESGSHAELLELGGRYARSWHEQVQSGESCLLR